MERNKDNQKAMLVKIIAEKYGVKSRYVYMVLEGTRNNENIFNDYMALREEQEQQLAIYQKTPLLNAVKDLVHL